VARKIASDSRELRKTGHSSAHTYIDPAALKTSAETVDKAL
jgi:hypothetical protein